jgi:hypothetical protein
MVRPPATNVNLMALFSEGVVAPTGDIVAVPFQVPANAAGIAAPAVTGGDDTACDTVEAGLLALPVRELLPEPAEEAGDDPRVSNTTARTMIAAAAAPQAARIGVRRDRPGAGPGMESPGA